MLLYCSNLVIEHFWKILKTLLCIYVYLIKQQLKTTKDCFATRLVRWNLFKIESYIVYRYKKLAKSPYFCVEIGAFNWLKALISA